MKTLFGCIILLLSVPFAGKAQVRSETGAPEFQSHPWSEESEHMRVAKSLLRDISIPSVRVTRFETMEFALTDEFIQAFNLTESESQRISKGIADAQDAYRTVEGKHLEPISEAPKLRGREEAPGDQRFYFRPLPFAEEAAPIRKRLEALVLSILGNERAEFFWENGRLLNGQIPRVANPASSPDGARVNVRKFVATTYTFVLPARHPGRVDLYYSSGGGSHGVTYGEPLDRYAPEPLKPVLARWRKEPAEAAARVNENESISEETADRTPTPADAPSDTSPVPLNAKKWDETAAFADIPKMLLKSIQIPGLTLDEEISPEAVALFGLTENEVKTVAGLYQEMKRKFEKIEREHLVRIEPGKNSFALIAFPEESAALKEEWVARLKELVGSTRGESLDRAIRTEGLAHHFSKKRDLEELMRRQQKMQDNGRSWLHRGTDETRLNVTTSFDNDGRPRMRIDHKTGGEGGERGSTGVPGGQVPKRWQHLLTPDMLGLPLAL